MDALTRQSHAQQRANAIAKTLPALSSVWAGTVGAYRRAAWTALQLTGEHVDDQLRREDRVTLRVLAEDDEQWLNHFRTMSKSERAEIVDLVDYLP